MARTVSGKQPNKWRTTRSLKTKVGNKVSQGTQTKNVGPDFMPLTQYLAQELNATARKAKHDNEVNETTIAFWQHENLELTQLLDMESERRGHLEDALSDREVIIEELQRRVQRLHHKVELSKWVLNKWETYADQSERLLLANGIVSNRPPLCWNRPSMKHRLQICQIYATDYVSSEDDSTEHDEMEEEEI